MRVNSSGLLAVVKPDDDVKLDVAKDLPSPPPPAPSDDDDDYDDDDDVKPPSSPPPNQLKVGQAQSPSSPHGQAPSGQRCKWRRYWDSGSQSYYFENEEEGTTAWDLPEGEEFYEEEEEGEGV